MSLDELDALAWSHFQGFVIRKDLVRKAQQASFLPVYVWESLLTRYCSSMVEEEVREGLRVLHYVVSQQCVRPDEVQRFISNLTQTRRARLIDKIRVKPVLNGGGFTAELPSLGFKDVPIADTVVQSSREPLRAGMFAEIDVECDETITHDDSGRALHVTAVRPMSLPARDWSAILEKGRAAFSKTAWKRFILRSAGYEPDAFSERVCDLLLLRFVPFVTANFNAIEIGPRGTGKSYAVFLSPYAVIASPAKITTGQMFTHSEVRCPSPLLTHDLVCFDEADHITFADNQPVALMKGYMDAGTYAVGREVLHSDASIVFHTTQPFAEPGQLQDFKLCDALPHDVRQDVAFMDRLHALIPGWEIPRMAPEGMTGHFGLCVPSLTGWWHQLRKQSRLPQLGERLSLGRALSKRDQAAVLKTVDGLLKLLWPSDGLPIPDDSIEWAVRLALESRLRIKKQQKALMPAEFSETGFSYRIGEGGAETLVQC